MNEDGQNLEGIIEESTAAIEACPDDVDALSRRGWAWLAKKEFDIAIADFDKALCWDGDRVDVLGNRGRAFCEKGDQATAIETFTKAMRCGPTDDELIHLHYNRGRSHRMRAAYPEAIEDFNETIFRDPQHVKAFRLRAISQHDLGDYLGAIADFDRAIGIAPKSADALHNRGNTWVCLGKFRNAIADFNRAIELNPNDPNIARTYNSRGIAWNRKGRYAKALADYEQAFSLQPESVVRRATLGSFLATCPQRRYRNGTRAVKLLAEACEITNCTDPDYLDCLAAAYAETGDFASAIVVQKESLALLTDETDIEDAQYFLGLYEAGVPWRTEKPKWGNRWA